MLLRSLNVISYKTAFRKLGSYNFRCLLLKLENKAFIHGRLVAAHDVEFKITKLLD